MNSHHFVHMLKSRTEFRDSLILFVRTTRKSFQSEITPSSSTSNTAETKSYLSEFRHTHEEWMRSIFEECCHRQKVNINKKETRRDFLNWVERIVLPRQKQKAEDEPKEGADVVRLFRSRWEKEISPSLLVFNAKNESASASSSKKPHGQGRRLELVYASTIQYDAIPPISLESQGGRKILFLKKLFILVRKGNDFCYHNNIEFWNSRICSRVVVVVVVDVFVEEPSPFANSIPIPTFTTQCRETAMAVEGRCDRNRAKGIMMDRC